MKVLQFAFDGGSDNPYLPEHHGELSVVYTGTHDNDTTLGLVVRARRPRPATRVRSFVPVADEPMPWALIRLAMASTARLAVVPAQDLLALGSETRMNTPGIGLRATGPGRRPPGPSTPRSPNGYDDWSRRVAGCRPESVHRIRYVVHISSVGSDFDAPDSYSRTTFFGAVRRNASSTSSPASSRSTRSSRTRTQPNRPEVYHSW